MKESTTFAVQAVAMIAACTAAVAQCANQYVPNMQLAGVDGTVRAVTVWDRDGSGPLPPLAVLGGSFTQAGTTSVASIVAFDPATGVWSPLGLGVSAFGSPGEVLALATAANGDLLVGGSFTMAGGVNGILNIARWDGVNWSALGGGTSAPVRAIEAMANGDVVVGGDFQLAGGVLVDRIARWNGVNWSPLGTGMNGTVLALTTSANGDLVAGGEFTQAGGLAANHVARWNGNTWAPMHTGCNATVRALATQGTSVFAGGDFTTASGAFTRGFASWNGTSWLPSVNGLNNNTRVHAIAASATDLYLGGIAAGAGSFNSVAAQFDGSNWNALEANSRTTATAYALCILPNGRMLVGGDFTDVDHLPAEHVAIGPRVWSALGAFSGFVHDVAARPDGTLVVTGGFTAPGIGGGTSIASWNGVRWTSLQSNVLGTAGDVLALPNGDIAVQTNDPSAGDRVYRWHGTTWTQLGTVLPLGVTSLAVLSGGDLVAGGYDSAGNHVWRWNGTAWVSLGFVPLQNGMVEAMAALPNDELLVSSSNSFTFPPVLSFWRWNGTAWSQLGANVPGRDSTALAVLPNGHIVAGGGSFAALEWDGTNWATMGVGAPIEVFDLLPLPDGDLFAVGRFTVAGNAVANRIARWNGANWSAVGAGVDGDVQAVTRLPSGDVVFAGAFGRAGGAPSPGLVRLTTNCPATITSSGSPCSGSAGPLQLVSTSLPWLGSVYQATATGFAPGAIGMRVLGLQATAVPLASLLPIGIAGCSLLAAPDALAVLSPVAGTVPIAVALPRVVALVGTTLHVQVLQLELGAAAQPTALVGSNALIATLGAF